jgi:hypothetical protein
MILLLLLHDEMGLLMIMMLSSILVVDTGIILVYASPFPEDNTTIEETANSSYLLGDSDVSFNATSNMGNETGLINGTDLLMDNDVSWYD